MDSHKKDRHRQVTTAGEDVESLLTGDPPLPYESWKRIWGWYLEAVDHSPPPDRVTLERITAEHDDIYRAVSPLQGRQNPYQ